MHVNPAITFARDGAGNVIADAESAKSFALAFAQRTQGVSGFTALADREDERIAAHRRVAMAELAGVFHLHRNVRKLFDEIFSDQRGVQCGPATSQHDTR